MLIVPRPVCRLLPPQHGRALLLACGSSGSSTGRASAANVHASYPTNLSTNGSPGTYPSPGHTGKTVGPTMEPAFVTTELLEQGSRLVTIDPEAAQLLTCLES